MTRYTDEFRAGAVLQLEAAGYPDKKGALAQVSRNLKVPHPTLSRWGRAVQNPPPKELVHEKRIDFAAAINDEMWSILLEMGQARSDASFQQLATAFGILFDKHQLLTGGPTENINQQVKSVSYIHENRNAGAG